MTSLYGRMARVAMRHPRLIPAMLGAAWASRARDWYRRAPFLPVPPRAYVCWRMDTAYGDPDAIPPEEELVRYLRWASEMRGRM